MKKIIAKVISQKGTCYCGHKVGDEFVIDECTPSGMCAWAYYTIFPFAQTLKFGGTFPWEGNSTAATVACPDGQNPLIFELKACREEKRYEVK